MDAVTILQVIFAAMIAFYAMVGGAFISASITSPKNCLIAITAHWSEAVSMFLFGIALIIASVALLAWEYEPVAVPIFWFGVANTFFLVVLAASRYVAESILKNDE